MTLARALGWSLIAAIAVGWLAVHWSSPYTGQVSDSVVYLFQAERYRLGSVVEPAIVRYHIYSQNFPPLFSVLLGTTGGGADALARAHLVTALTWLAAVWALFRLLRALGINPPLRWLLIGCFITALPVLEIALGILSEGLFTALALIVMERLKKARSLRDFLLVSLLTATALLVRTAGVYLLPALLYLTWRRRSLAGVGTLLLGLTPWFLWRAWHGANRIGPLPSYPGEVIDAIRQQGLGTVLADNLIALSQAFTALIVPWPVPELLTVTALIATLASLLIVARDRFSRILLLTLYSGLGMLLLWPFPGHMERFWVPLYPLVLALVGVSIRGRSHQPIVLGALALIVVINTGVLVARVAAPADEAVAPYRFTDLWISAPVGQGPRRAEWWLRFKLTAEEAPRHVPEDECVGTLLNDWYFLYTRRPTRRIKPDPQWSVDETLAWVRRQCRYVLAVSYDTPGEPTDGMYPYSLDTQRFEPVLISYVEPGFADVVLARFRE